MQVILLFKGSFFVLVRLSIIYDRPCHECFLCCMNNVPCYFPLIQLFSLGSIPHKRLGISKMASEDEIQGARNFLIQQYAGHRPSVDAIESAHDKIIMQKFHERKHPKIDITKKVLQVRQSKAVNFVFERFQTPPTAFLVKTAVTFAVLGALTVLFPTEEGPTLQVLLSVIATFYFIHQRLKKNLWSFPLRVISKATGSSIFSWLIGTFLMVSVIPPFIKGPRGFEVMSSLLSYVLLWVASLGSNATVAF
ncbi:hypothetical protein IGI04_002678 [Brassica rapa subsp. trilocularis]|uniref:Uncharacterized protein n=1 Tax=Brassica rapa subsp. trilocularis TaxID=1813537 RepID=A0ABQ7NW74_BRACM|nr:hypothetical protein IGI04_002678 [Brassica rapa subsp. trilocularis]